MGRYSAWRGHSRFSVLNIATKKIVKWVESMVCKYFEFGNGKEVYS